MFNSYNNIVMLPNNITGIRWPLLVRRSAACAVGRITITTSTSSSGGSCPVLRFSHHLYRHQRNNSIVLGLSSCSTTTTTTTAIRRVFLSSKQQLWHRRIDRIRTDKDESPNPFFSVRLQQLPAFIHSSGSPPSYNNRSTSSSSLSSPSSVLGTTATSLYLPYPPPHLHNNSYDCLQRYFSQTTSMRKKTPLKKGPSSSSTTTTTTTTNTTAAAAGGGGCNNATSSRSLFKQIPVQPSIYKYIQRIGVGIPQRNTNPNRKRHRRQEQRYNNITEEETGTQHGKGHRDGRGRSSSGMLLSLMSREQEQERLPERTRRSSTVRPPPPFGGGYYYESDDGVDNNGVNGRGDTNQHKVPAKKATTTTKTGTKILPLPVRVLASVGVTPSSSSSSSLSSSSGIEYDASFPHPSIEIPEIAIAGRSNVGKSTLLNSLLYGNLVTTPHSNNDTVVGTDVAGPRRRRRQPSSTRTSQTAKLPRGIKATTSSKPGETRRITFYKLSAKVHNHVIVSPALNGDDRGDGDGGDNRGSINGVRKVGGVRDDDAITTNSKDIHTGSSRINGGRSREHITTTTMTTKSLILVDLPGYGFAYGPTASSVPVRNNNNSDESSSSLPVIPPWQSLTARYLLERPRSTLKRILLLVDARHGLKKADYEFLESLQDGLQAAAASHQHRPGGEEKNDVGDSSSSNSNNTDLDSTNGGTGPTRSKKTYQQNKSLPKQRPVQYQKTLPPIQIVLTKCDLVPQADLARRVLSVRQQLSDCLRRQPSALPEMFVSAQMEGQAGVLELQKELASMVL